ncbi:MAG: type IX secretion system membrane protein PorP/SprF [Bacteroidota bacterium]
MNKLLTSYIPYCFKSGLVGLLFLIGFQQGFCQQFPYFINTQENAFLINPAITVIPTPVEDEIRPIPKDQIKYILTANGRNQWAEFGDDSPQTYTAAFQGRFNVGRALLWAGPFFVKDQVGPSEFTSVGAKASVHLYLANQHYIQAGISLQYLQYTLDPSKIISRDLDDPTLLINSNIDFQNVVSPSIGVFYSGPYLYAGISAPYLTILDPGVTRGFSNQIAGILGAYLTLSPQLLKLEPSLSVQQASNFPTRIDGTLKFWLYLQEDTPIWAGLGINNNQNYRVEFGFITDSNPNSINSPPYFKISFAYGNQIGLAAPLGNVLEGGINIMFP